MSNTEVNNIKELPLLAVRGVVIFPKSVLSFDIGRDKSVQAIEEAVGKNTYVFITAQKDPNLEEPTEEDLYRLGTVTKIKQVLRLPGNVVRVLAEGIERGIIENFIQEDPYMKVNVNRFQETERENDDEIVAIIRTAKEQFEEYSRLFGKLHPEVIMDILSCEEVGELADLIASYSQIKLEDKQNLLEEQDRVIRLMEVIRLLNYEIEILNIQKDILIKTKVTIDKTQKEYFLKEQMKTIQEELGDKDGIQAEIKEFKLKMEKEKFPELVCERLNKEFKRLEKSGNNGAEISTMRDYIELVMELPWNKKSNESKSLKRAEEILNRDHYGLEKVKERIIEFLAVRQNVKTLDAPILCLVGPPGVGKTSIAKSVASSLNRKYIRMSLGGLRDEAEIRGHRKTYVGAMPGRLIYSIKQAKTINPLILLDEIDKMSHDFKGDPASALLEVLDGEQNVSFRDHYLEIPFDLSDVLFICTANSVENIPAALFDRLEIINLSSYTDDEKQNIATKFLIDKQLKKHGLKRSNLKIDKTVIDHMIQYYTKEAGVRQLERLIGGLCRKTVKAMLTTNIKNRAVTVENLEEFLGKRKYKFDVKNEEPEIGIARGLAWTSVGGDTLSIEVNVMRGTGKLELTGNMGKVMKESAHAAMSYIRSEYKKFEIDKNFYKQTDIHIHIPEGAVPKDGPSAGITMATAMISAFMKAPVRNDVGMTGEITIRGRVLPIGGLKEKLVAAKKAGLKKIILPFENETDLSEIQDYVKNELEFVLAKNMWEVLEHALIREGI